MSLAGFQPVMWPTVFPARLTYSDYRTLTCTASQAEYVYRLNSLFDPDQTGVGGQPDGFDQLKTLYGRYRVVAVDVEVECIGQSANGLIAFAPSDTVGPFLSAEEVGALRYGRVASFSGTERARLRARYHIGKLLGYSDEAVLGSSNLDAAITASPAFQQYLIVAVEGGSSSTQAQNVFVRLTYYARMEVPIAVLDASRTRYQRFLGSLPAAPPESGTKQASAQVEPSTSATAARPVSVGSSSSMGGASAFPPEVLRRVNEASRALQSASSTLQILGV